MAIEVDTVTAPAAFASYWINDDSSGMTDSDIAAADAITERLALDGWYVVADVEDSERFTWSYRVHGGTANGGTVCDYTAHRVPPVGTPTTPAANRAAYLAA